MIERARKGAAEQHALVARGTQRVAYPLHLALHLKLHVPPRRIMIQGRRKLLPRPSESFKVWLEVRGLPPPRREVPFFRRNEEGGPIVWPCEGAAEHLGSLTSFKPGQARAHAASLVEIGAAGRLQARVSVEETSFVDTGMVPRVGAIDGQPSAAGSVLASIWGLVQSVWGMDEEMEQRDGVIEGQRPCRSIVCSVIQVRIRRFLPATRGAEAAAACRGVGHAWGWVLL